MSDPPAPPLRPASVLISCYRRRQYLLEAVHSVLADGPPGPDLEVVVLKDWSDSAIDDELTRLGVRAITEDIPGIGAALARGVAECTGETVSFLDDDDLFAPGKIVAVREAFARDPELVLFRTGWTAIGLDGRTDVAYNRRLGQPERPIEFRVSEMDDATFRWIVEKRAYGNLSTLSVRRRDLASRADEVRQIECGVDIGVPILVMRDSVKHAFDPRPLTIRRVGSTMRSGLASADSRAYTRTFRRLSATAASSAARRYAEMNVRWGRLDTAIGSRRLAVVEHWMGRLRHRSEASTTDFLKESVLAAYRFTFPGAATKLLDQNDEPSA